MILREERNEAVDEENLNHDPSVVYHAEPGELWRSKGSAGNQPYSVE
jgi:hypothetical protein